MSAKAQGQSESPNSTKTLFYEGCEYPYSTERIVKWCWVAKCSVKVNGVPFEVTMKGVSEGDAEQKLKQFFSSKQLL